mgnify:CR=1 FL=1
MKKIIFAALSVLMMLSLVGCGEHLVDFKVIDLSGGAVPGDWAVPATWDNTTPFTSFDKDTNTYTFEFTTKADAGSEVGFKILTKSGEWNVDGYTEFNVDVDGASVDVPLKLAADMGGAGNAFVKGCEAGKAYKMTVVCNPDSSATVSVVSMADPVYPVPYVLSGMFVRGGMFDGSWGAVLNGALLEFETSIADGVVVYKKDFTASGNNEGFKIASADWNNGWAGTTFNLNADYVEFAQKKLDGKVYSTSTGEEIEGKGDTDNAVLNGTEAGKNYRLYIKTTPDGKVFAKVEEICEVSLTFKITGLTEGDAAWINGSVWGWGTGWPLAAWNSAIGNGLALSDAPVADADGVAVFGSKWNFSTVAKPGDTLSYEVKFVASDDDWATTKYDNANIKFDINVEGAASYIVTVDATTNTISITE